jgi:NTE family protein
MKLQRLLILLISLCCLSPTLPARQKIGLVLGGGGAKGAAEIGALKVIEEVGIPIDYIAGTSIGSIVGGLYAMDVRSPQLDSLFVNQDWLQLFTNNVREFLGRVTHQKYFHELRIPFRCVAADVNANEEVVMSEGLLCDAMRASMSIPGVFKPVIQNGRMLMDGGLLNNLPVDVVKAMGADVVIAIDLQQKQHKDREFSLKDLLGIDGPLNWLVERPDWKKYNANRKAVDVYIHPMLDGFGASDFNKTDIRQMIELGYEAGVKAREELIALKRRIYSGR